MSVHVHEPTVTTSTTSKFLPLAATIYVVAILVGNGLAGESPENMSDLAGTPKFTIGVVLEGIGLIALFFLIAWAGMRLNAFWSRLALTAGTTTLAVKLASGAPGFAAIHDDLDPELGQAFQAINDWAFVIHWLPFGVMVLAIACGAKELGLLRAPGAWIGAVLGGITAVQTLLVIVMPAALVPLPFVFSLFWLAVLGVVAAKRG